MIRYEKINGKIPANIPSPARGCARCSALAADNVALGLEVQRLKRELSNALDMSKPVSNALDMPKAGEPGYWAARKRAQRAKA